MGLSKRKNELMEADRPFFIKKPEHMATLERWLQGRAFNCGGFIRNDRNGNPMVFIGYDRKPEKDSSLPDPRGLIIVLDHGLLPNVEAMVQRLASRS